MTSRTPNPSATAPIRGASARTAARWALALTLCSSLVLGASWSVLGRADQVSLPAERDWPARATAAPPPPARGAGETLIVTDGHTDDIDPVLATNLAAGLSKVRVLRADDYKAGMLHRHRAGIYVGGTEGGQLPEAFLRDVRSGRRPVAWLGSDIDQLATPGEFMARYGWVPGPMSDAKVNVIKYKGALLSRAQADAGPLRSYKALDRGRAEVLADAVGAGGRAWPWAVRSRNLTYVGEVGLQAASERDRYLAVSDLLYGLIKPGAQTGHRAMVRLEDISPVSDPKALRAAGEALHRRGIPFGFAVYPVYRGPLSDGPRRQQIRLKDRPEVVRAITYLLGHGGSIVLHGYTHQNDDEPSPTNGESGEDFEFFRTHWNARHELVYDGPVKGDSEARTRDRLTKALAELRAAHLPAPKIMELAHYAASPANYRAVAGMFAARYDRGQYFARDWRGRSPASPYMYEQFVPYLTRDVYGSTVIPETLGFVVKPPPGKAPSAAAIVANARAQLVVRDNLASFFYHPFLGTAALEDAVDQMRALGYRFVSPSESGDPETQRRTPS